MLFEKIREITSGELVFGGFKPFGTIAFQNYSGGFLAKNAGIFIFDQVTIDYTVVEKEPSKVWSKAVTNIL